MKKSTLFLPVFLLLFACAQQPTTDKTPPAPAAPAAPVVGGDSDEHGCKGSAGYQWSVVKNECIRIFESGIRLNARAKELDPTLSAFVVFKSDTDDMKAEMFIPTEKGSILLDKTKKESAGTWKNDAYTLTQYKGMYTLSDAKGKVLYEGSAAK